MPPLIGNLFAYIADVWSIGLATWAKGSDVNGLVGASSLVGAGVIGGAVGWLAQYLGLEPPKAADLKSIGAATGVILTLFVVAPYRAWSGQRAKAEGLKPNLEARFDLNPDGLFTTPVVDPSSPTRERLAKYVRGYARATNQVRVEGCRATITKIEKTLPFDTWELVSGSQASCKWADSETSEETTIAPGGKSHFDIVYVVDGTQSLQSRFVPFGTMQRLTSGTRYRFTIVVDAPQTKPQTLQVDVDWMGGFNLTAQKVS